MEKETENDPPPHPCLTPYPPLFFFRFSHHALQIAAAAGATVIATSSSAAKLAVARRLGATHLINYREQPDWAAEVLRVTAGQGADLAVEVVAGRNVEQTVRAIRRGGVVAHVGMLDAAAASTPVNVMAELWYGSKTSKFLFSFLSLSFS